MANELALAGKFIYTKLAADSATPPITSARIYHDHAPESATFPYIVYSVQSGFDVGGLGTVRLLTRPVFQIKAIGEGDHDANLRTLGDRIDAIFQNQVAVTLDDYVFSTRRLQPILFSEDTPGKRWTHYGGLYRFEIHPVAV
jgi:hypothetical protein